MFLIIAVALVGCLILIMAFATGRLGPPSEPYAVNMLEAEPDETDLEESEPGTGSGSGAESESASASGSGSDSGPVTEPFAVPPLPDTEGSGGELIQPAAVCTVEFVDWDNTLLSSQLVGAGQAAIAPKNPSREGYGFAGWDRDFSNVQHDMTVRAVYEILETYTVSIFYLMSDGKTAAQPYLASLPKGETLREGVRHPAVSGYVPQPEADYIIQDTEVYSREKLELNIASISTDHTYTVQYIPDDMTQYKVYYHLPKLPPETGYDTEMREFMGATESIVQAPAETFTGFAPPADMPEAALAADGSTTMDAYYTRKTTTLFFDTAGGNYIEPISGLFGTAVTAPADPQKLGSTFISWNMEVPVAMPGEDLIITAQWEEAETANYMVVYWMENANDDGYSLLYSEVRQGKVGQGYGTTDDDLELDAYSDFWAPADYYEGMPVGAANPVYKLFYRKSTEKIAEENEDVKITSDGTAVFNIYHSRFEFIFIYDMGNASYQYYITHNNTKYYEREYQFTAKFGADISAYWPSMPATDNPDANTNWRGYESGANRYVNMPVLPRTTIPALICCTRDWGGSGYNYYPTKYISLYLRTTTDEMVYYTVTAYAEPIGGADDTADYEFLEVLQFYVPASNMNVTISPIAGFGQPDPSNFTGKPDAKTYFPRQKYQIHFNSGGEEIHTASDIWYQEDLAKYSYTPNAPPLSMPGYTFGGWYTSSAVMTDETAFDFVAGRTMPPADLTLYAKWDKPVFDVNFAPNNGEEAISQKYEYGDFITLPAEPEKDGYRFMGWQEDDKDYLYMFSNPVVRNLDLIARWEPVSGASYTVRYIDKANNEPLEPENIVDGKQPGSTVTEAAREIAGFLPDFVSKSLTLGSDGGDVIVFYYTAFDEVDYTLNYQDTGGEQLKPSVTKSTGNTIVTENFTRIPGYYPVMPQMKLQLSSDPAANIITFLYIKNGDISYTVEHYLQNVNGIGYYLHTNGTDILSAPAGAAVTAKARSFTGFVLNKQASDDTKIVNSNGSTVLRLYYDRNLHTVSFSAQTGGSLVGVQTFSGILYETPFKDAVTVPVPQALSGYTFTGWSPALPDGDSKITHNAAYTAQFAIVTPGPTNPEEPSEPGGGTTPTPNPDEEDDTTPTPVPPDEGTPQPPDEGVSEPGGGDTSGEMTQEEQYAEIRRQTLEQMKEDGVPMVRIGGNDVPLFGLGYDTVWALLNLILAIAGAIIALVLVIGAFIRKRKEDDDEEIETYGEDLTQEEEDQQKRKHALWRIIAVAAGIAGVIAFILTENMNNLLVILVDNWTLLMVLLFIPTVIAAIIVRRKRKEDPEEEGGEPV